MLYCKDLQSLIFWSNHFFHRRIPLGLLLPLHLKDEEQIQNHTGLITRYCNVLKETDTIDGTKTFQLLNSTRYMVIRPMNSMNQGRALQYT